MREDIFHWIFNSTDIKSLFNNLDYVSKQKIGNLPLKMCVFLSSSNISDLFGAYKIKRTKVNFEIINEKDFLYKFHFEISGNMGSTYKSRGIYFKHPAFKNVFIYLSFDNMFIFKKVIQNYFDKFYPDISRGFLKSDEIKKIIDDLTNLTNSDVLVSRFVVNKNYPESSTEVKYPYEKISYKKAFFEADAENCWVDSMNIYVNDFSGFISRQGFFRIERGSFNFFKESILEKIVNIFEKRRDFYSNRERMEQRNYNSKPLVIKFGQNVFNSSKDIKEFITRVFDKIPNSSYSISHFNPYLQLLLTDFGDGSSFDIWILNKDSVYIMPQFRSTCASISKIVNTVFDNFSEGEVSDLKDE